MCFLHYLGAVHCEKCDKPIEFKHREKASCRTAREVGAYCPDERCQPMHSIGGPHKELRSWLFCPYCSIKLAEELGIKSDENTNEPVIVDQMALQRPNALLYTIPQRRRSEPFKIAFGVPVSRYQLTFRTKSEANTIQDTADESLRNEMKRLKIIEELERDLGPDEELRNEMQRLRIIDQLERHLGQEPTIG